jgi:hypothetical protein
MCDMLHRAEQLYADIRVEEINQHHAHVCQMKDIEILVDHFVKANIFQFALDQYSEHAVVDLYRHGLYGIPPRGDYRWACKAPSET